MSMQRSHSDVVIVGAGLVGCATAYYLALRGLSVQIVERGRIGGEQSSRAWGFVRQQGRHVAEAPLAAEAARVWEGLAAQLQRDVEFVRSGILVLAQSRKDEIRMVEGARAAQEHGVGSHLLSSDAVRRLVPELSGSWRCGLFTPEDGHAEPVKATRAFAEAALQHSVRIDENTLAVGIELTDGKASGVITPERLYSGHAVLCAAGIGAAALTRTVGLSLPIQVVRACVAQTHAAPVSIKTAVWTPHAAFRPKRDGSFYIGNGYRSIDAEYDFTPDSMRHLSYFLPTYIANWRVMKLHFGKPFFEALRRRMSENGVFQALPEPEINQRLIAYNKQQFDRLLPGFSSLGIARSWAGRIDATPDLIPIIDRLERPAHFYIAAGFNGHGLALGPVVGKLLAELIVDGKPSIDLRAFRVTRFADGDVQRRSGAL